MLEDKISPKILNFKLFFFLIIVTCFTDQISKLYLIKYLKTQPGYLIPINEYLDIVYTWNYGISFGIFSQYYQYSNFALLVFNTLVLIFISKYLISNGILEGSLIIGGAISNLIDRAIHHAVFDFISFHYNDYYFPIFNLADVYLNLGGFLIIMIRVLNIFNLNSKS